MSYANLTAPRDKGVSDGKIISIPMADNIKIYKGSLVCIDATGYAEWTLVASRGFAGVALETVDNTGGLNGAKSIRVTTVGVHNFAVPTGASMTQAHLGAEVYWDDATTPATVVLSDPGLGPKVGRITKVISATEAEVLITGYAFNVDAQAS